MSISFAPSSIRRCASEGVTDVIVIVSVLLTVEWREGDEERLGSRIGDPIPERLAFAAESDQAFIAHLRQMLRQGRLRQADIAGEIADRALAMLDELADRKSVG